jgi:hypothetical protein
VSVFEEARLGLLSFLPAALAGCPRASHGLAESGWIAGVREVRARLARANRWNDHAWAWRGQLLRSTIFVAETAGVADTWKQGFGRFFGVYAKLEKVRFIPCFPAWNALLTQSGVFILSPAEP